MRTLDIKERLEKILEHLNINQKEFSRKTGISENTISHAKKGKHIPTIEFFNSIYRFLPELNPKWLYMGAEEMFTDGKLNGDKLNVPKLSKKVNLDDCNDELEKAEKEISILKDEVADKKKIINSLKNAR
jgi:transcriptional regulator with XRE-family HTH domain